MVEDKDYIEINRKDSWFRQFLRKAHKHQDDCTRKHVPYCLACARIEFEDSVKQKIQDFLRKKGIAGFTDVAWDVISPPDTDPNAPTLPEEYILPIFDKIPSFGGFSYFTLLDKSEAVEQRWRDGMRASVTTGLHYNFKCKRYGHGCSIFVPIEEHDEWQKKNKISGAGQAPE